MAVPTDGVGRNGGVGVGRNGGVSYGSREQGTGRNGGISYGSASPRAATTRTAATRARSGGLAQGQQQGPQQQKTRVAPALSKPGRGKGPPPPAFAPSAAVKSVKQHGGVSGMKPADAQLILTELADADLNEKGSQLEALLGDEDWAELRVVQGDTTAGGCTHVEPSHEGGTKPNEADEVRQLLDTSSPQNGGVANGTAAGALEEDGGGVLEDDVLEDGVPEDGVLEEIGGHAGDDGGLAELQALEHSASTPLSAH